MDLEDDDHQDDFSSGSDNSSINPLEGYEEHEDKMWEEAKPKSEFLNKSKKDFDDEVDYEMGTDLIERFRSYIGLKNFKTSEWTKIDDFPTEYESIFSFLNFKRS